MLLHSRICNSEPKSYYHIHPGYWQTTDLASRNISLGLQATKKDSK